MTNLMKSKVWRLLLALVLVGVALFAAGCSSEDSPTTPTSDYSGNVSVAPEKKGPPDDPGPPDNPGPPDKVRVVYAQDFELLVQDDPSALANDGWWVYGNVYYPDGTTYYRGYGPYVAPNSDAAFCNIASGVGDGLQCLNVFCDYKNEDLALGYFVDALVFQEFTIRAIDIGKTITFSFDAKWSNLEWPSTALAFIKTLDPDNNYWQTNFVLEEMTNTPDTWTSYTITLSLEDPALAGQILQFGFSSKTNGPTCDAGIFYDNVEVTK